MQRAVRSAELVKAIGSCQEDQPSTPEEGLKMEPRFTQGARQSSQASCARHGHHLLAYFESLQNKAEALSGSFLLAYNKLTRLARQRASACNRA
jgi:hypothetical protein